MANATTAATAATPVGETKVFANFRDFNTTVFEARITHTEIRTGEYGPYVSVTAATNLKDGDDGITLRFNDRGSVLKLAQGGHLMAGRRVHLTGCISGLESAYLKEGVLVALKRPRLQLAQVQLRLGAKPKSAMAGA